MRKYRIILLFIFIVKSGLYAQPGFQKLYRFPGSLYETDSMIQPAILDSLHYLISRNKDFTLTKIDTNGNLAEQKSFKYGNTSPCRCGYYSNFYLIRGKEIILTTVDNHADTLFITSYNYHTGGYNWTKYFVGLFPLYSQLQNLKNGDLALCARTPIGGHALFLILDSLGNLKHSFQFNGIYANTVGSVFQLSDYSLLVEFIGFITLRMDTLGNILWQKQFCTGQLYVKDAVLNADESVTMLLDPINASCGNTCPTQLRMCTIDTSGTLLWARQYVSQTGWLEARTMKPTPDSGYIILADELFAQTGGGLRNGIAMLKMDKFGHTQWAWRYFVSPYDDYAQGVNTTPSGGYVFTGLSCQFIPPVGFCNSQCCYDVWLAETDSVGNLYSCNQFPLTITECAIVLPDTNPNYIVVTPNIATGNASITDTLLPLPQQFSVCTVGIPVVQPQYFHLGIKPNPANSEITITSQNTKQEGGVLYFYNAVGNLIKKNEWSEFNNTINISNLVQGIYFLKLLKGNSVEMGKLMVQ